MFDFINKAFQEERRSRDRAMERLRLVLVHDRTSVSPHLMDALREDLINTISKYIEIDDSGLEVSIDSTEYQATLVANIPIRRIKR
ncbi:MAG: cell division topological specificity factor MinE [Bacillota bacterium]